MHGIIRNPRFCLNSVLIFTGSEINSISFCIWMMKSNQSFKRLKGKNLVHLQKIQCFMISKSLKHYLTPFYKHIKNTYNILEQYLTSTTFIASFTEYPRLVKRKSFLPNRNFFPYTSDICLEALLHPPLQKFQVPKKINLLTNTRQPALSVCS